jgi:membrane protein DedA with SNARE-associated domain
VGGPRGVFVSLIDYAQRHYSFLLLLVFLLTFSKSCALISLLVPGTSGLLLLGPLASASLNHFLFMWLSASLGAIGGFWLSWWLGRHHQYRLLQLRWLRGERLARSLPFLHRHGAWAVFFGRFLSRCAPPSPGQRRQRSPLWRFQLANVSSGCSGRCSCWLPAPSASVFGKIHCVLKRYLNSAICSRIRLYPPLN